MTPTTPGKLPGKGPKCPHSPLGERAQFQLRSQTVKKRQVINLLVANVNLDLLTQPIERALN